jgi:hypothetical protein
MSMQEFDISRSRQQEIQQDCNADQREQYQEESQEASREELRHESYAPLLNAPYSVEEKIRPERVSEYTSSTTNRAGLLPAIILIAALGLMGLGGLLGFSLSHSGQFVSPAEPLPYYSHPHFERHFNSPFHDNDDGQGIP